MALHRLLGIEVGVPDPDTLDGFYQEIGFTGGNRCWGAAERPDQIRVNEAPYRQLLEVRVACETEADLATIAKNVNELGVASDESDGKLIVVDPINKWRVIVEPTPVEDIPEQPVRKINRPGDRTRLDARHSLLTEPTPRTPRRLGHVVCGTTDLEKSLKLMTEGIGFRISDSVMGMAFFLRCSPDHHNFLLTPGPVPHINHYAMEHDDIDSVCSAATKYLRAHDDVQIAGPGRHQIGGNMFWYMRDPSGTFFEFFADMDRIIDDEGWRIKDDWDPGDAWSLWGDKDQPEVFFEPKDMAEIIAGWNKANG
jgi:catechol 2,3-dioxygenase-like lactoylglutathione lyase family enzyme